MGVEGRQTYPGSNPVGPALRSRVSSFLDLPSQDAEVFCEQFEFAGLPNGALPDPPWNDLVAGFSILIGNGLLLIRANANDSIHRDSAVIFPCNGLDHFIDAEFSLSFVSANMVGGANVGGVMGRMSSDGFGRGYVWAFNDSLSSYRLGEMTNGAVTILGDAAGPAILPGQKLKLRCVGNQITGLVDNVVVVGPLTDNTWGSGRYGMAQILAGGPTSKQYRFSSIQVKAPL